VVLCSTVSPGTPKRWRKGWPGWAGAWGWWTRPCRGAGARSRRHTHGTPAHSHAVAYYSTLYFTTMVTGFR